MALIHVDLPGYLQTACIHLMASSMDGKSYILLACWRYLLEFRVGLRGCHCPRLCVNGLLMIMGCLWHVINTSSSLYTVAPSLVNMDTLPSLSVLPTLINYVGNYLNVSDSAALLETWGKGSLVTYLSLHTPPLATPTFLAETRNIGRPKFFLSFLLR